MPTALTPSDLDLLAARLDQANRHVAARYPGERGDRQPVHTVYGGAHLFRATTAARLGSLALEALDQYAPDHASLIAALRLDPETTPPELYARIRDKLDREPVEDYRIDFEDGYGNRSDEEEDGHAGAAAAEVWMGMDQGTLPPFIGIRVKPLSPELHMRSLRTLDVFVGALLDRSSGELPDNFVVTLPKITHPDQAAVFASALELIERRHGLPGGKIPFEVMVELTQTIFDDEGRVNVRRIVDAGAGRVTGAHFGTYDYTASCNITARYQHMAHPSCDFARHVQQVSLGGTGVWLSDGGTNVMPVPLHRGENPTATQLAANRESVHEAWRLHYGHIRHSLAHAYYQGWDLHPAQLPTRYAAVYSFFLEGVESAGTRLRNFVDQAAQATLVGEVFDDAATGQGLLNFFLRAVNSGAVTEAEAAAASSLTLDELHTRSFLAILRERRRG